MRGILLAIAVAVLAGVTPASASVVNLDFEGIGLFAEALDFYNGGTDADGNSGPNYGIYLPTAYGVKQTETSDPFPSPVTAISIGGPPSNVWLEVATGFQTEVSFWYLAFNSPSTVEVFDDLGGSGNLLASLFLAEGGWQFTNLTFDGIAKSIRRNGGQANLRIDDLTLEIAPVPLPATLPLMFSGFLLVGLIGWRRKRSLSA